jgi:hypothetical protein
MSSAEAAPGGTSGRGRPVLQVALALAVLAGVVLLGRVAGGYVPRFAAWVESAGVWGPLTFIVGPLAPRGYSTCRRVGR